MNDVSRDRSPRRLARSTAAAKCAVCRTRPVYSGFGCTDCVSVLRRQLDELVVYWCFLPYAVAPQRGTTGRLSPGYASSPPLRLDVVAFLAPQRAAPAEEDAVVVSLPSTVQELAEVIAEARGEEVHFRLPYLREHLHWAARNLEGFAEIAATITGLHARAQVLAHDKPSDLGRCLGVSCSGRVREVGNSEGGKCERCDRPYTGLALVRLRVAQDTAA